jgi:AraC family transcriptional regulator of adaptative response / DNA-3-methyladenine glycosylase II
MDLDPASCERARRSRDARFDGRFFIAVRTTGIYCRPICPARTPREQNVAYYVSAAAAEEGGFRACRRCRPETAPGTPAWRGTSSTVARALRLIEEGALDGSGVPDLAARLGVGERQLRRLFAEHIGASPLGVARTRRAHFARRLIDETALPMAHVAATSGFGSLRQFNDAIRSSFGAPPSELRRRGGASRAAGGLRLPFRAPLAWPALLAHLELRAIPGVEEVTDTAYRRCVASEEGGARIEVRCADDEGALVLRVEGVPSDWIGLAARVRRLFDLAADPLRIAEDLGRDAILRPVLRAHPGLRLPGAFDTFESAVRTVLGQQVSVRGASTLAGRIVKTHGTTLLSDGDGPSSVFPGPQTLAEADLAGIGLPGARARAIRELAAAVAEGRVRLDGSRERDETVEALCALPGIGPWSAEVIALRALGDPDAFPAGDLGLRKALGEPGAPAPEAEVARHAQAWRPWRGYAAQLLWSMPAPGA